jgi:hypothetical protein
MCGLQDGPSSGLKRAAKRIYTCNCELGLKWASIFIALPRLRL